MHVNIFARGKIMGWGINNVQLKKGNVLVSMGVVRLFSAGAVD